VPAQEAPPPSQEAGPGGDASRPVSRVLSPLPRSTPEGPPPAVGDGHPSGTPVARRLERPHPGSGTSSPWSARRSAPVRPCSGRGLPGRPVTRPPVGSYPTISPLPRRVPADAARLCPFCGTLLRVAPTGCYPAPCSVEPGLSSSGPAARGRPAGLRAQCSRSRGGGTPPAAPTSPRRYDPRRHVRRGRYRVETLRTPRGPIA
jgi:hypothetical protein